MNQLWSSYRSNIPSVPDQDCGINHFFKLTLVEDTLRHKYATIAAGIIILFSLYIHQTPGK
jgi:hypothetical protein